VLGRMTLAYETRGDGRPVVLLPWFSLDRSVMAAAFEPIFVGLDGWRRLYVDLPGCGASPGVQPPTSDAVAHAVVELLDATLASEPCVLVGCSYGGYIAAAVARRWPDRVGGLAMVCAGVKIGLEDRHLPRVPRTTPLSWTSDVDPSIRSHLDLALGTDDAAIANQLARLLGRSDCDEDYLALLRERGYQLGDEDDPTPYAGPTLVVTGRQDRVGGYEDQFEAMTRYPHGTYAVLDGAGHYLPFELPEDLRVIVARWLSGRARPE
jgi:pimeloyl-ACP methyl ester carboxylesterase